MGATSRLHRNTNATNSPELTPQASPHHTPAPTTAAMADTPNTSLNGKMSEKYRAATICWENWASMASLTRRRMGSRCP